jgi:ABC-2 type transport system permease protein
MKNILILFRRQFLAYFRAPLGYAVIIVFLIVAGLSFCRLLFQSATESIQVGDILFGSAYFWLVLLIIIALITMPLFAEERHSGTIETLLTAPVTDLQVVLAKFTAAFMFIIVTLGPTLLYGAIIYVFQAHKEFFSFKPIITGYLIVLLIGAFYTAFGLLMSSLTRSMVVAAILCCTGMSITFLAENLQYVLHGGWIEKTLAQISSIQHIVDFSHGMVDSQPVVLYLSGTVLFLYLTIKSLESRLWR